MTNFIYNVNLITSLIKFIFVTHRLTMSSELGDQLSGHCKCSVPCKCSCQALAQNVYSKMHMHRQAVMCLLKQGRVYAGINYARQLSPLTREDFVEVLRSCPSLQLMQALVEEDADGVRLLPIGLVIMTVLENNLYGMVLPFIQNLQKQPSIGMLIFLDFSNDIYFMIF